MKALKLIVFLLALTKIGSAQTPDLDLITACRIGDVAKATAAVGAGADVNHLEAGNGPLTSAFFWPEVTRLLLDKGANPNLGDFPALVQATLYYSTDVLKMLLDAGADPNKPAVIDPSGTFKTLIANEKAKGKAGNKAMIKAWEGALAASKPIELYPLHHAVLATGCASCVEMLIAKGAKLDLGVTEGTLLHTFAWANGSGKSKESWKQAFPALAASIAPFGFTKLPDWYVADMPESRFGTAEQMLKVLLAQGLNINEKNQGMGGTKPQTPLELALNTGLGNVKEIMLALINNGADVKMNNEAYGPLLFQAAQTGITEVVKAMIEKGADINAEGRFFGQTEGALLTGYCALTIAAMKDNLELVKYLIGAGAKTDIGVEGNYYNARTRCLTHVSDKTPIYYAIENYNAEMVKFMAEADVKWWKRLKIHEKKQHGTEAVVGGTAYVTSCFGAGLYVASMYIDAVTKNRGLTAKKGDPSDITDEQVAALKALKPLLKSKGI